MNFLVGFDEERKMSATITTFKEDADYQLWCKGRNKVINEYKYIKDKYSWDAEEEGKLIYIYIYIYI